MTKTGLFFGSFNPIHVGHLIIANFMVESSDLSEIWFVISPQNPFKQKKNLLDKGHRLYMVNLAVEDNFHLRSCDIEFNLPVPSYTVDTLVHLREKYPDRAFSLLMGSDNLKSLHKWKNYRQILAHHEIFIYPRPGSLPSDLSGFSDLSDLSNSYDLSDYVGALAGEETVYTAAELSKMNVLEVPLLDLSASFIRQCIKDGKSIRYMVTDPVLQHLKDMKFYT